MEKMRRIRPRLVVVALVVAVSGVVSAQKPTYQQEYSIPTWVTTAWKGSGVARTHNFDARLNPFCLRGDFDGDSVADFAILVKELASGKTGVAIIHRADGHVFVVGAGKVLGNGGDEWSWMDAWAVFEKKPGGAALANMPSFKGDALVVTKTEAAGGLVWWDGTKYRWQQRGD